MRRMRSELQRAERWLEDNLFVQTLLERSHLRPQTFKALLFKSWVPEATFEEIARRLGVNQPWAWKCWKRGRDSIIKSYLTLKLAIHAGLLDAETVELLLDDLLDYRTLLRGEGDREEILYRIERRTLDLLRRFEKHRE